MCAVFAFLWLFSKQKAMSAIGIGFVAVVVAFFGSDAYFNRMKSITDYQSDESAESRIMAWKAGVRMAVENPVLGVGTGHFASAFGGKYRAEERGTNRWMTAHSMYFLVLGELGLPGIVTLFALVLGGIRATLAVRRRVLRSAKDPPSDEVLSTSRLLYLLAASAVGFAVAGAFLSVAYYPHIFILTGMMLSARAIASANTCAENATVVIAYSTPSTTGSSRKADPVQASKRFMRSARPYGHGK